MDRQYTQPANPPTKSKTWHKVLLKGLAVGLAGFSLFFAGWAVGDGRISLFARDYKTQNPTLPANLDYASVEQVYDALRTSYDGNLDVNTLLDGLKQGLAQATNDSYTEYLNDEEAEEFNDDLNGEFDGIGAELTREENTIVIVSPIKDYPAQRAGLRPKDVIVEINDESAYNLTVTEAVKKIRGPAGTKVKLTIIRDKKQELEFEITREHIVTPSVKHEIKDGIGYLQISRFADDTAELARKAAMAFKHANVRGVVVDVRSNPGGLLDAAVKISGMWLDEGATILEQRRGGVAIKTYKAPENGVLLGVPTVVLINEGSASASEILAGALLDNKAATLVGVKTFGKGSVQGLEEIPGGGVLKVTIARWYTPTGRNIDKEGIAPTQTVEISDKDIGANRDPQKQAAIKALSR